MGAGLAEVRGGEAVGFLRSVSGRPWLPYVLPFFLFLVFLSVESRWPQHRPWLYPFKTLAVALVLIACRRAYTELRPRFSWLGVAVGALAIVLWIALDPHYPAPASPSCRPGTTTTRPVPSPLARLARGVSSN